MALWFMLRGASCFKVFSCSLSSRFFIPFSIVITSLGEDGAGLCASLYVCFLFVFLCAHVSVCPFSLPLGVGGWLWFVIVAHPGLFYYFFHLVNIILQNNARFN